jgi:hypothetical protein
MFVVIRLVPNFKKLWQQEQLHRETRKLSSPTEFWKKLNLENLRKATKYRALIKKFIFQKVIPSFQTFERNTWAPTDHIGVTEILLRLSKFNNRRQRKEIKNENNEGFLLLPPPLGSPLVRIKKSGQETSKWRLEEKASSRSQIMRLAADGNSVGKRDGEFFLLSFFPLIFYEISEKIMRQK